MSWPKDCQLYITLLEEGSMPTVYPSFKVIAECQYLCSNYQSVKNHGSITELALIEILHLICKLQPKCLPGLNFVAT